MGYSTRTSKESGMNAVAAIVAVLAGFGIVVFWAIVWLISLPYHLCIAIYKHYHK
jgi:hypothetical protein